MTLLAPSMLWSLVVLVPLVAIYFLKVRPRRKPTTAYFLWEQIFKEKRSSSLFQSLRDVWSLVLMLLAAAAIALALARPEFSEERRDLLIVIDTSELGQEGILVLFVVLAGGRTLDAALEARLVDLIRTQLSPRHRPDVIRQIREVPTTLTGKKLEIPVKRLLSGVAPEQAVARSAVANPHALDEIVALARSIGGTPAVG